MSLFSHAKIFSLVKLVLQPNYFAIPQRHILVLLYHKRFWIQLIKGVRWLEDTTAFHCLSQRNESMQAHGMTTNRKEKQKQKKKGDETKRQPHIEEASEVVKMHLKTVAKCARERKKAKFDGQRRKSSFLMGPQVYVCESSASTAATATARVLMHACSLKEGHSGISTTQTFTTLSLPFCYPTFTSFIFMTTIPWHFSPNAASRILFPWTMRHQCFWMYFLK